MKFDKLLREKLGTDPAGDEVSVIVEYEKMPTASQVGTAQSLGVQVTGASREIPVVYARATKEQLLALEKDPSVKRISYSAPVGIL